MFCYRVELQAWKMRGAGGAWAVRCWDRRVFAETPDRAALLIGRLLSAGGWVGARINVCGIVSGCADEPPILRREDLNP
jgi:hypothetical protein